MTATDPYLTYWRQAAAEPLGLRLHTHSPGRLTAVLYSSRARARDPALNRLTLRRSPLRPDHEIWLEHG